MIYEKANRSTRGVPGSTRYVEMKLSPGTQFENYYWMEGPLSGDSGCRVTVLHNGQVQQCSFCLRRADNCPGRGNGKACESLNTERGRIGDYMKYLREKHGYTSLKMEYMEKQFPALGAKQDDNLGFGHMVETEETTAEINTERDNEIENLRKQVSDMNVLKQKLVESEAKLKTEMNNTKTAQLKLKHVEKVASQRILESMPFPNFEEDSNHLTMLLATVQENDDFEYNAETDRIEPRSAAEFLKKIQENCQDNPETAEKLGLIRNKVLEKLKRTVRRERRQSMSGSTCSRSSSRTRPRSEGEEMEAEKSSKVPKTSNIKPPSSHLSKLPAPKL